MLVTDPALPGTSMKLFNISQPLIQFLGLILFFTSPVVIAEDGLKPFVLAASIDNSTISAVSAEVETKLQNAGFELIGQYSPYEDTVILVFSSKELRELATRSKRGGYGAVLRVSLTRNNGKIELAYTNPLYWANAYRLQTDAAPIATQLKSTLRFEQNFGSGDLSLSATDLRKYHYTFMMEYFDDPSVLNYFDSHEQAVATVRDNLAKRVSASSQVFELGLGSPSTVSKNLKTLTDRELQVFEMIGQGLTTRQITDTLSVSPKTVETYRHRIRIKLGFQNSSELAVSAAKWRFSQE